MLTNKASSTYHHNTLFNGSASLTFSITYHSIQDDSLIKCTNKPSPTIRTDTIKNIKQLKKHNTSTQYAYLTQQESKILSGSISISAKNLRPFCRSGETV
jgi:hypothetical protein